VHTPLIFIEIQSNISNDFDWLEVINILGELLTPPDPLLFYYLLLIFLLTKINQGKGDGELLQFLYLKSNNSSVIVFEMLSGGTPLSTSSLILR